ncbi:MAG: hypothetical protein FWE45_04140 [Firmicutes bacterium]|nr:hypothetical protein [Bacillota bacterium]
MITVVEEEFSELDNNYTTSKKNFTPGSHKKGRLGKFPVHVEMNKSMAIKMFNITEEIVEQELEHA